jgi:ribulose-phosphate 3-epimerase
MGAVIAPSILSADFTRLGEEIRAVEAGGAAVIHVDVMDGHFVPNLTLGPAITAAARRASQLPLDCHLMVEDPDRWVDVFADAGADMISVHVEAAKHLHRTVHAIRERKVKAGVVLNPATPLSILDTILPDVDFVLLMSVNPGFGGQSLIPSVLDKVRALRNLAQDRRLSLRIEIDGGVDLENLDRVAASGPDIIVSGSAIFGSSDVRGTTGKIVRRLAEIAESGRHA